MSDVSCERLKQDPHGGTKDKNKTGRSNSAAAGDENTTVPSLQQLSGHRGQCEPRVDQL